VVLFHLNRRSPKYGLTELYFSVAQYLFYDIQIQRNELLRAETAVRVVNSSLNCNVNTL
jgi:hypothetical protein